MQAEDKEFKLELSRIAEMSIWDDAKETVSNLSKSVKLSLQLLEQELSLRENSLTNLSEKVHTILANLQ